MKRILSVLAAVALAAGTLTLAATPAAAIPVKCAAGDPSPDGRVFPEPRVSVSLVRFEEFECGVRLLEQQYPDLLEVVELGRSAGDLPLYDVLLTDETSPLYQGAPKERLLIVSSIHGNEPGGREGAVRVLEDLVDPAYEASQPYVADVLERFVVHFVFANPDGWVAGDVAGTTYATGIQASRANEDGVDLNRNFAVTGYINAANRTLQEPESQAIDALLSSPGGGWYLGTDNHGQSVDTYGAAGLQIVGQFDYQKSETLVRYADAIEGAFSRVAGLTELEAVAEAIGADAGAYHWGTLYDMLGYSASGSLIDYYNTFDGVDGTGYATELTAGQHVNELQHGRELVQVWVDSIRAINFTMLQQALIEETFTFPVPGRTAYVHDPALVTDTDANGVGHVPTAAETLAQRSYSVSRMRFFTDLSAQSSSPLTPLRVPDVLADPTLLDGYDALVLADDPMPEGSPGDAPTWYALLRDWVAAGGTLVVTDAAAPALAELGLVAPADVTRTNRYVGYVDFGNRSLPLNAGLRGVARQTYDSVPIGFAFPPAGENCPNWTVSSAAWNAGGGLTAGTNGTGRTVYGEKPLGDGTVRFLGALLPQPTEDFYHPFGLQSYAVTYTGYQLLENMLAVDPAVEPVVPESPVATLLPLAALGLAGVALARRRSAAAAG